MKCKVPVTCTCFIILGLILTAAFSFSWASETTCTSNFAQRTGRENCWVKFTLDSFRQICIPHAVWIQWLKVPDPPPICSNSQSEISSRWRAYSHLENSQTSPLLKTVKPLRLTQTWQKLPKTVSGLTLKFQQSVERLRELTSKLLKPSDPTGILRSLIIHEGASKEPLPLLRKLGFVHLISATGIHLIAIGRVCDRLIFGVAALLQLRVRTGLWLSRILSLTLCSLIWLLSGARIGMLRPWAILLMKESAISLGFRWRKASPLFLALFLETLPGVFSMNATPTTGRLVYALAVGGGLLWYEQFKSAHLGLAVGSWALVAVWEIWHEATVSLVTPIVSLITLPIICLGVYPATVISIIIHLWFSPAYGSACIATVGKVFLAFLKPLTYLSLLPGNLWIIPRWALILGLITSGFWLYRSRIHSRIITFTSVMALIFLLFVRGVRWESPPSPTQATHVEQLDVGQGDAALVISRNPEIVAGLVDTGSLFSLTDVQWINIFAKRRIHKLDWVLLTHLDEDHSGGLIRLTRLISIRCVSLPKAYLKTQKGRDLVQTLWSRGTKVNSDDDKSLGCIPFPTLQASPDAKLHQSNAVMNSIWIPLVGGGFYLAAGDATKKDELRIADWAAPLARHRSFPRILKVSHHGSKTSTTQEWLDKIKPDEAWISVGLGNPHGHPAFQVLNLLKKNKIMIRRTDSEGVLRTPIY